MFYEYHEKTIYVTPDTNIGYDPLAVLRTLTIETAPHGGIKGLWEDWRAPNTTDGDVSQPMCEKEAISARAEIYIVRAARMAFALPDFPECLDATALEYFRDFIGWIEGKGQRVATM